MLIDAVKPFCHDKCIELGNIAKIYISILRQFFSNTNTQYVAIREMEIKSHVTLNGGSKQLTLLLLCVTSEKTHT